MCNVTFQTLILLMNTIVTKAKIQKNQNVDISSLQAVLHHSPILYCEGTGDARTTLCPPLLGGLRGGYHPPLFGALRGWLPPLPSFTRRVQRGGQHPHSHPPTLLYLKGTGPDGYTPPPPLSMQNLIIAVKCSIFLIRFNNIHIGPILQYLVIINEGYIVVF